ncbi:MAG TPA: glycosyltransferase [Actinobacteria bacterium]|nr:glycosyltransferase [Actinomycetota bacterium]
MQPKILWVSFYLPYPLDEGGKIRSHYLMKSMAEKYDIVLACLIRSKEELKYLPEMQKICKEIHPILLPRSKPWEIGKFIWSLIANKPYLMERVKSKKMQSLIDKIVREKDIDLILIDHLHMAQYVENKPVPKILDEHNVESELVKQRYISLPFGLVKWLTGLEHEKLYRHEKKICKKISHIIALTDEDKEKIRNLNVPTEKISVLPIGVALEEINHNFQKKNNQILFIGALNWPPNEEAVLYFYNEIIPFIKNEVSDITFLVAGKRPSKKLKELAEKDKNLILTGYVDDIKPLMRESSLMVVPLKSGSGMRVKILEAFSVGLPVVSTSIGCEGIEVINDESILIADKPNEFAKKVAGLMKSKEKRNKLAIAAHKLAEAKYSWEKIYQKADNTIESLISDK